jgi:hypothetical protein
VREFAFLCSGVDDKRIGHAFGPRSMEAELAQSVERTTLNRVVQGSIP